MLSVGVSDSFAVQPSVLLVVVLEPEGDVLPTVAARHLLKQVDLHGHV